MRRQRNRTLAVAAALALLAAVVATPQPSAPQHEDATVSVIVRASGPGAEAAVMAAGGTVDTTLGLIDGFTATLPVSAVTRVAASPDVAGVTPNGSLTLAAAGWEDASSLTDYNPNTYEGSMYRVGTSVVQVGDYWQNGYTGAGVDIALIDSGVVPVAGLTHPGKVVNGPDLSFESQAENLRYLDTFGHGTHLAGIMAGRDTDAPIHTSNSNDFLGIAPGARIISLKVAASDGATDVSQVIAAIDWVVQHRNDNGMNIRVLNLAFGTDSNQSYMLDPLSFAVEQAWKAGIVVVVASGNDGNAAALRMPAANPYVIAVGAANSAKTRPNVRDVMEFSNCGTGGRHVDVVVPGESIVSLRNPGSSADVDFPSARVVDRLFLGSGTSQAAAVVSGMAALIVDQRPSATPDQVKQLLADSSSNLKKASPTCQGAGLPNLDHLYDDPTPSVQQNHPAATGTGLLEASRGSDHVEYDGTALTGEQDIFGMPWDGLSWSQASAAGLSWSGGSWNGSDWTGNDWNGLSWSGLSWSGLSWSGLSWSGLSWSGLSWSENTWNGLSWSGLSWSGLSWSGLSWSGSNWTGLSWK